MESNMLSEQVVIQDYFKESALLATQVCYKAGRLSCWKSTESLHSMRACTFSTLDGTVFVPNSNEKLFEKVISAVGPEILSAEDLCSLIENVSPDLRIAIFSLKSYMANVRDIWHVPVRNGTYFEAFFDNKTSGQIEKITLDGDNVVVQAVGEGIQLGIL